MRQGKRRKTRPTGNMADSNVYFHIKPKNIAEFTGVDLGKM